MPQKQLKVELLPSFVRIKTTPDMRAMAGKLAKIKRAIGGIKKIESILQNPQLTEEQFVHLMSNLELFADYSIENADDAIAILKNVRKKVAKYVRSL